MIELADLVKITKEKDSTDKKNEKQTAKMARDKNITKGVNWSKVCCVFTCKNCNAPRYAYSQCINILLRKITCVAIAHEST